MIERNYLDDEAREIFEIAFPDDPWQAETTNSTHLYRIYAVLSFAKGLDVTSRDVHNAWVCWSLARDPNHRSNKPFDDLTPDVQALDDPYALAIREAARRRIANESAPAGAVVDVSAPA